MGRINIPRNTPVTVSFSHPVDHKTITISTFSITNGDTVSFPVGETFTFEFGNTVVTFSPTSTFAGSWFPFCSLEFSYL